MRNSGDSTQHFLSASIWLAITAIVGAAVVLTAWTYGLRVGFHPRQTAIAAAELTAAAALAMLCRNATPRCAAAVGSSLILVLGAMAAGILGSVGQMFALPFVDGSLAAADELLGFQTADVVRVVIRFRGGPPILAMLYELATPMLFVSTLALSCLGRFERVWELCAAFSFCIFAATVTSVLFPAAGAFEHSGIAARFGAHLPGGSGVYHLKMLYSLRSASELTIDPFALRGMVTFPSFHTAMALMTAAAWRDDPYLRGPMIVWNVGVIASTIPIGGHYVVDLLGGAVTWALIQYLGRSWASAMCSNMFAPRTQPLPA